MPDFLSLLFDDAYFIHIVRNPIGVAYSYKNQSWAPDNYAQILVLLSNLYEKIIKMKQFAKEKNLRFKEIKLEDLSEETCRKEIIDFLQIENSFDGSIRFEEKKVNYYKDLIPTKEYNYLYDNLNKYIKHFNYT